MNLKLCKNELFWSLIDPQDIEKIGVILNANASEVEINYDKLPHWAKQQIVRSVTAKRITTSPVATLQATEKSGTTKVAKKTKKKVAKKKVAKKTKVDNL